MMKNNSENFVLSQVFELIAKAKKDKKKKEEPAKIEIKNQINEFEEYDPQNVEQSIGIIKKYFYEKSKFIVNKNTYRVLDEWFKQSYNYYLDLYFIAKGIYNLNNNQLANNTDTIIDGTDKAHRGYRHFHTNGQTYSEYSLVYYKNKNSGNIYVVGIDTHKDLKAKKNKAYPNISTLN